MDLVCIEMGENVYWKSWVKVGSSPRFPLIVLEWHLGGHLGGTYFFHTYVARYAKIFRFSSGANFGGFGLLRNG